MGVDTSKMTELLAQMRAIVVKPCYVVTMALDVCEEYPPSPALDALRGPLLAMVENIKATCREYNNLRALAATWEREQGTEKPRFYEGVTRECGLPIGNCTCGVVPESRKWDVAHAEAGNGDLATNDGHATKEGRDGGDQQAVANVSDDLHSQLSL